MRVAAIDIGTNTFLLLIADVEAGRILKVLYDEARVVRLGQDVDKTKRLHPDALLRADECLTSFAQKIAKLSPQKILACATSAARDVENQSDLVAICERHHIPLKVIGGDEEAEFTYLGTIDKPGPKPTLVVDVGGGSTEYILGGPEGIRARQSLDIGAVRMTEKFFTQHPVPEAELTQLKAYLHKQLSTLHPEIALLGSAEHRGETHDIIAVSGTPTTMAAVDQGQPFESSRINGYRLSVHQLGIWIEKMAAMSIEERQKLPGMEPKRADVILAGAMILKASADFFGTRQFVVSTRGLRFGIALSLGGIGT